MAIVAFRGWVPHDEGTLGQAATRILDGQWPHSDFLDVYPGFLGVIHAVAFLTFSESIATLRLVWLGIAGIASISLFSIFRTWLRPMASVFLATSVTTLGFVVYPASMPSWWNVTLGLLVLALILRAGPKSNLSLFFLAGVMTGVSVLIKTTGGAFIAIPVVLWLASHDRRVPRWLVTGMCVVSAGAVLALVSRTPTAGRFLMIALPILAGIYVCWSDQSGPDDGGGFEWSAVTYAVGVSVLPMGTIGLYALTGRLPDLIAGWITSPALRFEAAERDIPFNLAGLLLAIVFLGAANTSRRLAISPFVGASGVVAGLTVWTLVDWEGLCLFLFAVAAWMPALLAAHLVLRARRDGVGRGTVLVTASALFFTLIQIPLWNGFYAAYTVPLVVAAVLMIGRRSAFLGSALVASVATLLLIQSSTGFLLGPVPQTDKVEFTYLTSERARISVPWFDGYYDHLSDRVATVAGGQAIYAGPDAPEVAFLAGVPSATPGFFEILDIDWSPEIPGDLASAGTPIVINHSPSFSDPISTAELARIYATHLNREEIGKFELRWTGDE